MSETKFIGFREDIEIIKMVDEVAEARGQDRSSFIRGAIRRVLADLSFLPENSKKALGLKEAS
ncbi:MAG: hypothetical protein HWN68_19840 [Desulfobacterales bacterium]|nr:hypothetical protein [Desulfobacterales bacterium]